MSRCNCSNGFVALMHAGKAQVAVPTTVHCDHLIQAKVDAVTDLARAKTQVMKFLIFFLQCLNRFWKPGAELFIR
jgi:aconitate hydratase